ncbi:hypothetical protein JOQ06_011912 [Pogonophryne albipinna]|uniref:Uncharacterized protein n=1 Tax=Pogonophryne albipinna TaxID=1090488 RepID=A0AAD6BDM9_9TELE|nr:hypothetical protein JOQ06_011912 [Pogonophryne albipinna]
MIVQDDLFEAKLNFFVMVAREVTPFLKLYQTDKPMLPFMSEDLSNILRSLMEKFIKPSVMKNATTTVKLLQVDLTDPVNHMDVTKLRVGFVTERGLEEHMKKNSEKAESQGQLSFISKSNGLRRAAEEKERHLEILERQLTDKLKELKDTPLGRMLFYP